MKKLVLPLFLLALLTACGGAEEESTSEENSSEEVSDEFTPPECPTSTITMTENKWDSDADSAVMNDYSFDVAGSAGYFHKGKLMVVVGDTPNENEVSEIEYPGDCHHSLQFTIDDADVGEFDVTEGFAPVQPYVDGLPINCLGHLLLFRIKKQQGRSQLQNYLKIGYVDL